MDGSKPNDMETLLRRIHTLCSRLRDIQLAYQQLEVQITSGSREQEVRDRYIHKITVAAFALAILNLIAQIVMGRPSSN